MEEYKGTHVAAPNFAWSLVLKRLSASDLHVDLSSLQYADIAAEPINPSTLKGMTEVLGIKPSAIGSTYGLAESTVFVCTCNGQVDNITGVVACGDLSACIKYGTQLRIINFDGSIAAEGVTGEVYIQSSSLAAGYLGQPEATEAAFGCRIQGEEGRWYRTGDLGYVRDNLLFLNGRAKDLIIINGKNVYPHDLERHAENKFCWLRSGSTVAFQW